MTTLKINPRGLAALAALGFIVLAGCGGKNESASNTGGGTAPANNSAPTTAGEKLSGNIASDGSSTVGPITQRVAEAFQQANPDVKIDVTISGTGSGFKRLIAREADIANASRQIEEKEISGATEKGVEYIELPVAYDGITVVVNKENTWVDCITVAELKKIWEPAAQNKITNWKQINPKYADQALKLYGPGTESGTFDYFTKGIVGTEKSSRSDYQPSEEDNTLVTGVAGDKGGMAYFGFAYYEQNQDKLKALQIDAGEGCVAPSPDTINNGTYKPLSRPLFLYVRKDAADRPEIKAFVKFYLTEGVKMIKEEGYVPFPQSVYDAALKRFEAGTVGKSDFKAEYGSLK